MSFLDARFLLHPIQGDLSVTHIHQGDDVCHDLRRTEQPSSGQQYWMNLRRYGADETQCSAACKHSNEKHLPETIGPFVKELDLRGSCYPC